MSVAIATERRVSIRVGQPADLPVLVGMLRTFITSPDYGQYVQDNAAKAEQFLAWMLSSETAQVIVTERDGHLIGMLGVMVYPHPMSGELMGSELFWWLDPDHRGNGVWMLRRAETWATAAGAVRMQMMHPVTKPRVGAIYQRVGYTPIETLYQKDLR